MAKAQQDLVDLCGYFMPDDKQDADDEDSDGDADEDFENLDFKQMTAVAEGAALIPSKPIGRKLAKLRLLSNGSVVQVEGRFILDDPWWQVTVKVKQTVARKNYKLFVRGYPAYKLRDDAGVGPQRIVNLFLHTCQVESQDLTKFNEYLRSIGCQGKLTFENLKEYLQQFSEASEENKVIVGNIYQRWWSHEKGIFVSRWLHHDDLSHFFTILPQLLPKQFLPILMTKKAPELGELQDLLGTSPWVFGFSPILSYRHGLVGCEAQLDGFYNSGLMDTIPIMQRDALHIYHVLKNDCNNYGHTYLKMQRLMTSNRFKNLEYKVSDWQSALDFLEKNHVIVCEDNQVYLKSLWRAEVKIAEGVASLFTNHLDRPCVFDLDYDSEEFEKVRSDNDQLMAAYLCSQSPLVVISGKGGCGKTTVVTKVFKQAEKLMKEKQDESVQIGNLSADFDESGVDDLTLTQSVVQFEREYYKNGAPLNKNRNKSTSKSSPGGSTSNTTRNEAEGDRTYHGLHENNEEDDDEDDIGKHTILFTAPTGKAASLLRTRSKLPSFTLHQVNFSFRYFTNRKKAKEKKKEDTSHMIWKHSNVEVLITDESSLVSVRTFSTLLDILLNHAKLQKVVLLGDVNQLPSIEPGNFMSDIFQSLERMGCSIVLRTNHRSESQLIVDNASLIAQMKMPQFNPHENFHFVRIPDLPPEVTVGSVHDSLSFDIDGAVKKLLSREEFGKGSDKSHQFVAFRRTDCTRINELCCLHYSRHSTVNHKKKVWFQVGDKVCCSKNGDMTLYSNPQSDNQPSIKSAAKSREKDRDGTDKDSLSVVDLVLNSPKKVGGPSKSLSTSILSSDADADEEEKKKKRKKKSSRRLCNGEIFFIENDWEEQIENRRTRYLGLRDELGELIYVNYRDLMKTCRLKHAWARTIHTYQGSESETVIYVVGSATGYQTWQHVYTAITRGKKQVYIVTRQGELMKAVSQPAKYRFTSLKSRLADKLSKLPSTARFTDAQKNEALQKIVSSFDNVEVDSSQSRDVSQSEIHNLSSHSELSNSETFSDWSNSEYERASQLEVEAHDGRSNDTLDLLLSDMLTDDEDDDKDQAEEIKGHSDLDKPAQKNELADAEEQRVFQKSAKQQIETEYFSEDEVFPESRSSVYKQSKSVYFSDDDDDFEIDSSQFRFYAKKSNDNDSQLEKAGIVPTQTRYNRKLFPSSSKVTKNVQSTMSELNTPNPVDDTQSSHKGEKRLQNQIGSPTKYTKSGPEQAIAVSPVKEMQNNRLSQEAISPMRKILQKLDL